MTSCFVAYKKNEAEYIEEWLKWNLEKIFFDKIVIFDDDDGENLMNLTYVKNKIEENKIFIIKCNELKNPQLKYYNYFLKNFDFSWAAFLDCDEFIDLKNFENIKEYIKFITTKTPLCGHITLPWLMYGDNEQIHKKDGLVQERFPLPSKIDNGRNFIEGKCIVKKNEFYGFINPHFSLIKNGCYCFNDGEIRDKITNDVLPFHLKKYDFPFVKHYWTKSLEEFKKKVERGNPDGSPKRKLESFLILI